MEHDQKYKPKIHFSKMRFLLLYECMLKNVFSLIILWRLVYDAMKRLKTEGQKSTALVAALWGVFTPELSGLVKMDSGVVFLWVWDVCNGTAIELGSGSEQYDQDLLEEVVLRIAHCWSKPPPPQPAAQYYYNYIIIIVVCALYVLPSTL